VLRSEMHGAIPQLPSTPLWHGAQGQLLDNCDYMLIHGQHYVRRQHWKFYLCLWCQHRKSL